MIKTFRDKDTESIFRRERFKRFTIDIQKLDQRELDLLDGADAIEDLRVPSGNRLEKLSGNRRGQCSIRVNNQWRICFYWKSGHATDVEIVDYHSFVNDDTADWLCDLAEQNDLSLVRETISRLLSEDGYLDTPYATEELAAIEADNAFVAGATPAAADLYL